MIHIRNGATAALTLLPRNLLAQHTTIALRLPLSPQAIRRSPRKVLVNTFVELAIVVVKVLVPLKILRELVLLMLDPLGAHLVDLGLVVEARVVALVYAAHALPDGEMLPVDGDAVVFVFLACADVRPAALLLLEVEAGGIWEEQPGEECAGKTEPGDDVEFGLRVNVVVQNGGEKCTGLANSGRKTMSRGTNGGREDLGSDEEGDAVGSKLVEEGREEIHGLERVDVLGGGEELEVEGRHNEEDEIGHETNNHHPLAAVELVVDEERSKVVAAKRDTDVDQVVEPSGHDGAVVGRNDLDKLVLEKLVAVEEDIVGKPCTGSGDKTGAEVRKGHLK